MKPTINQKDLIEIVSSIIDGWRNTNDISSPTIQSDIKEELSKIDYLTTQDKKKLTNEIQSILNTIKYRVNINIE